MLKDTIQQQIIESMKAKNSVRTETLRLIKAELLKAETADRNAYNESIENKVIQKMIASHKDSIAQFTGRQDLIDKEQAELDIIKEFAPAEMSEESKIAFVSGYIEGYKQVHGSVSMKDMKSILAELQKANPSIDGKCVSTILKHFI